MTTRRSSLCRSALTTVHLLLAAPVAAGVAPSAAEPNPTIRLRIDGSSVYGTEREVEIREALIFDTLSVFIGDAKGTGGIGRARVGTWAMIAYLTNQPRGCGRLQEVIPSLTPPKKRAAEFARRIAPEKPEPNAPFVPFDATDPAAFDLQLQAIDFLDRPQLEPFEGRQTPRWWRFLAYAEYLSGPQPWVRLLHGSGNPKLPACPDPAKGWIPSVAAQDMTWCRQLPLRFTREQSKAAAWKPFPVGVPIEGRELELWSIVPPAGDSGTSAPPAGELEDGYRIVASIDAREWSLHADVPAKRCPGLRHVHVEPE